MHTSNFLVRDHNRLDVLLPVDLDFAELLEHGSGDLTSLVVVVVPVDLLNCHMVKAG